MEGAQKIIPVTQAKKELLEIVKEMAEEDITVAVTKNGVPVSVLMSATVTRACWRPSRSWQTDTS